MNDSDNVDNDFEYSRRTYYDLIEKGNNALEEMMEVAKALEHPRAFEVVSGMIKNISDVNDRLMDLHKKKKEYNSKGAQKAVEGGTTNNNLFLGSTTDLQRMLHDAAKANDIIDVVKIDSNEPTTK